MAVLGLRFCARAFPSCGKRGPLLIAVHGPLTATASPVGEHRLQTRRLSSCGSRAQLLRGMWDPPRPGLEPVSPALAGRLSTTAPPGKPKIFLFKVQFWGFRNSFSQVTTTIRIHVPLQWTPSPILKQPQIDFYSLVLPFPECHKNGIIKYVAFWRITF